ncbi:unnamed protein product [Trichogramma brassicae]|uniref:C2H2-type domain-containing protein n=1 Tax=Trichogramma brassicae TaxID=86971 RepID=A0A6H5I077_9HYME|nr:unnamed protein product [Trichogramma brassicae]
MAKGGTREFTCRGNNEQLLSCNGNREAVRYLQRSRLLDNAQFFANRSLVYTKATSRSTRDTMRRHTNTYILTHTRSRTLVCMYVTYSRDRSSYSSAVQKMNSMLHTAWVRSSSGGVSGMACPLPSLRTSCFPRSFIHSLAGICTRGARARMLYTSCKSVVSSLCHALARRIHSSLRASNNEKRDREQKKAAWRATAAVAALLLSDESGFPPLAGHFLENRPVVYNTIRRYIVIETQKVAKEDSSSGSSSSTASSDRSLKAIETILPYLTAAAPDDTISSQSHHPESERNDIAIRALCAGDQQYLIFMRRGLVCATAPKYAALDIYPAENAYRTRGYVQRAFLTLSEERGRERKRTVHEGRKDYACDKCEKTFGYKSHLLSHQRTIHEGLKDFACEKCEQRFGQKSNMLTHLKIVHEDRKDFDCDKLSKPSKTSVLRSSIYKRPCESTFRFLARGSKNSTCSSQFRALKSSRTCTRSLATWDNTMVNEAIRHTFTLMSILLKMCARSNGPAKRCVSNKKFAPKHSRNDEQGRRHCVKAMTARRRLAFLAFSLGLRSGVSLRVPQCAADCAQQMFRENEGTKRR